MNGQLSFSWGIIPEKQRFVICDIPNRIWYLQTFPMYFIHLPFILFKYLFHSRYRNQLWSKIVLHLWKTYLPSGDPIESLLTLSTIDLTAASVPQPSKWHKEVAPLPAGKKPIQRHYHGCFYFGTVLDNLN